MVARTRRFIQYLIDIRIWYTMFGVLMSLVAHELFHLFVHAGHILKIEFFPTWFNIVSITVDNESFLTKTAEEAIAYAITILILLITIIDVYEIHDSRDRRSVHDTIYKKTKN